MIEMEIKAILNDTQRVKEQLKECGCVWGPVIQQSDSIYLKNNMIRLIDQPIFRIRESCGEYILTFKSLEEDLDTAIELEVRISNPQVMEEMLDRIGYCLKVEVIKNRQTTEYKGFKICIDTVIGLGDYIELEKISDDAACKDKVYEQMLSILSELNIEKKDIRKEKYFELLLKNC